MNFFICDFLTRLSKDGQPAITPCLDKKEGVERFVVIFSKYLAFHYFQGFPSDKAHTGNDKGGLCKAEKQNDIF